MLGAGSYGEARLVFRDKEPFVAKVSKYKHVANAGREQLKREVRIMAILGTRDHPHLVRFRHSIIDGSFWCIIMSYCNNGDLSQLIECRRGKQLAERHVQRALLQLLSAVDLLHSMDVFHRDIKPQNVFLHDGVLKLGDLGLSKQVIRATIDGVDAHTQCGSPLYSAPEVHAGQPYDSRVDIWGLGCTIFELMMLTPAFAVKGDSLKDVFRAVLYGNHVAIVGDWSDELRQIIGLMLAVSLQTRPSSVELLRSNYFIDLLRDRSIIHPTALQHRLLHQAVPTGAAAPMET